MVNKDEYIIPETRVPADDLHRWQYVSIFISFHAIIFQKSHGLSQLNRAKTKFNAK